MSTLAVRQTIEDAKYSENVLPICANFNDSFTWNTVSGESSGLAVNATNRIYAGQKSLRVSFDGTDEIVFNRGNSDFEFLVERGGYFILSYRFYKSDPLAIINFKINVFTDGVLSPQNIIEQTLDSTDGFIDYAWNAYTQVIFVGDSETIDFSFSAQSSIPDGAVYLDGMSLMYDDRQLGMLPVYREVPTPITTIEVTETIDVPSIGSNDSYTVAMTVTGAVVGDFITGFVYPIELITLGLTVGQPLVTDTDEVSFIIHNHSGSSINPATGDYTIKIVK
jgi:hypothetical protein